MPATALAKSLVSSPDGVLSDGQVREFVREMAETGAFDGKRVLAIIPDDTRTAPMPLLYSALNDGVGPRTKNLHYLIALGTHQPLSEARIEKHLGLSKAEREEQYPDYPVFNHAWYEEGTLREFGRIPPEETLVLTEGRIGEEIVVLLNKMILDYDLLFVCGPTFPHEVIGFSGGNKYFFPGISGGDVIDFTHWLGALYSIPNIIGRKATRVRAVVDRAAQLIPRERLCLSFVVTKEGLKGLFFDEPETAWERAADESSRHHIKYAGRKYRRILAQCPEMYDEIWTAGKCMYKLMTIVERGGDLIIWAPHITEISATHGEWLEKVGYHVSDYFLQQMDLFEDVPRCVLAHSVHVKGLGTYENGNEIPDVNVILATGIPRETCEKVNLGYMDPGAVRVEDFENKEEDGLLYVPNAGEVLYLLKGIG